MKVRTHKFRSKVYKIIFVPNMSCHGLCEAPTELNKKIKIRYSKNEKVFFENCIHESLHALFWDIDEEAITEAGEDLTKFLWRLGFRQNKNK